MHVCVCVFISVRLSAPSDPVDTHGRVDSGLDLDALRAERGVTPSWVSEGSFTLVGEAWYLGHKAKATEPREFLLGGKRGVNRQLMSRETVGREQRLGLSFRIRKNSKEMARVKRGRL